MIDGYVREGRRYVTVAVGCTGGKHRSVAIAEALSTRLAQDATGSTPSSSTATSGVSETGRPAP